jgi:hypothetical protein
MMASQNLTEPDVHEQQMFLQGKHEHGIDDSEEALHTP